MRRSRLLLWGWVACFCVTAAAQVVAPVEIKDPGLHQLQTQYLDDLKAAGQDILAISFDYPFYLSRKLDLDESHQKSGEQRSLRFDHFDGKTVLAITGNYYAAYSNDRMGREERARQTYVKVVVPLLQAVVPHFQANKSVQGYALEISHHVLGKVMNVPMERPENLVIYLPQNAALRLLTAKDETVQQAALIEGQTLLNAQPVSIWINGEAQPRTASATGGAPAQEAEATQSEVVPKAPGQTGGSAIGFLKSPKPQAAAAPAAPARDTSPVALAGLEAANKDTLARMVKEMTPQAHLVDYAPPDFFVFRQGIYLELSISTAVSESAAGSRYKMAAFAFDDHVAHLIRPALGYFKGEQKFDGLAFSTTAKVAAKDGASEAVEFFFPFDALRCYERFDCTGQQLIDAGAVLINGERVSLDLQVAESGAGR